jgi:uncharacterized membrane protein YkoI
MKRRLMKISAVCLTVAGVGSFSALADKVPLTQLPEAVQKAIKAQSQGETLQDVERETRDGRIVYDAEFKREGFNRHVTFASDGSVLADRTLGEAVQDALTPEPSIALSETPAAVQKTVKEQQAGRAIADIDKETWNGQTVYEVEFKEKGPNSRIHIAPDGSLVVSKERKPGTYIGTQLSETPAAVQNTVKSTVSNATVEDVDRETKDGQIVYDVEIKQEGLNRHLKIAENGTLLSDSNQHDSKGVGERVRERLHLGGDSSTVTLDQVPAGVKKTITDNGAAGTLKPIKREVRDGLIQYDVEFEKSGRNTRLTINEDGTILKDNRR